MASPTAAIDVDADVTAPSACIVRGTGDAAAPLELASSDDEAAPEPLNIVKLAKLDKSMTGGDRVKALWKEGQKKLVAHGVDPDHAAGRPLAPRRGGAAGAFATHTSPAAGAAGTSGQHGREPIGRAVALTFPRWAPSAPVHTRTCP